MNENKEDTTINWIVFEKHPITSEEYEEAPEWQEAMFANARLYEGEKLIRRGRPLKADKKVPVKLRLDPDVLAAYKATGKGWQTMINQLLKDAIEKR